MPLDDNDIGPSQMVTSTAQQRVRGEKRALIREPITWRIMLKMFWRSMKQWREHDFDLADKTEHKRRYAVCKKCDFLVNYQCQKCGCLMFLKSKLAGMQCKDNRW